jgi:hypothetical protein
MRLRALLFLCLLSGLFALSATFASANRTIGPSCHRDGRGRLCLGVKIIAFADPVSGRATLSPDNAVSDLRRVNSLWSQCGIGFQIDRYDVINPTTQNIAFAIANNEELTEIRSSFATDQSLLIVSTGRWNRKGSLGQTAANAWTAMPGSAPYGAIVEQPVITAPNIIAHELGHYLSLPHVSDATDLMNPVIYTTSALLTANQCDQARDTVARYWSKMMR